MDSGQPYLQRKESVVRRLTAILLSAALVPVAIAVPTVTPPVPPVHPVPPRLTTVALLGIDVAAAAQPAAASIPAGSTLRALSSPRSTAGFATVGVTWAADRGVAPIAASVRIHAAGRWSAWTDLGGADDVAPDPGSADVRGRTVRTGTSPLWAGPSDGVQARVALTGPGRAPRDLRVDLIDPGTSAADRSFGTPAAPPSSAGAAPGMPAIITRAQWGADESIRTPPPSYSATVKIGFVHHTDTSNVYTAAQSASIVRSIYAYHVLSNGWSDIGYNFLVDRYGQVFEGRYGGMDRPVLGAHTGGFNTDSFAGSLIGNFTASTPPPAMIAALERLFAWKLSLHYRDPYRYDYLTSAGGATDKWPVGQNVLFSVIAGHRDADYTTCPGDVVYSMLPRIRADVRALMTPGLVNPGISTANGAVRITAGVLGPQAWTLTITNAATGTVVRRYAAATAAGVDVSWPRTDAAGLPVPSGRYRVDLVGGAGGVTSRPWSTLVDVLGLDPGPGAASTAAGTLDVLAAAPGVTLAHDRWSQGSGWTVQSPIRDGAVVGGPAVVASLGQLQVFVRGTTSALYRKVQGTGDFSPWSALGGSLTSQPAAVAYGNGIRVLVRGADGALWQQDVSSGGRQYGWRSLAGRLGVGAGPAAASTGSGAVTVFVQGTDGALWTRRFAPGYDSGWSTLGGRLIGGPAAASSASGRVDVFARGVDNALWTRWSSSPGVWSGWASMGGQLSSAPAAAVSSATGKTDVVVRGATGSLYQKSSADRWAAWYRLP